MEYLFCRYWFTASGIDPFHLDIGKLVHHKPEGELNREGNGRRRI